MTLNSLMNKLLELGLPVFHFEAANKSDKYIVWAEDGQGNSGYADNHMTTQILQGTIDYFTKDDFDPAFDLIQQKLNNMDIAWRLGSIQREEDTGYIHYEWIWEMVYDGENDN